MLMNVLMTIPVFYMRFGVLQQSIYAIHDNRRSAPPGWSNSFLVGSRSELSHRYSAPVTAEMHFKQGIGTHSTF